MAGTTEWGGVTYGFYARKQATLSLDPSLVRGEGRYHNVYEFKRNLNENMSEEPDKIVKRGINKEGEVEIQYGSGKKVIYGEGSTLVITPEKDSLRMMYMQVMDLVPPLPDDPEIKEWIGTLNNNMDDIVQHLLDDNEESFSNYRDALSEYSLVERINEGMKMIGFLIE